MKARPQAAASRSAEFDALYQSHSREVWGLAYARLLDGELAMDVTQEAFLRLWRQWNAGESIINPRAWLLRVARNLAEDDAKSAFRRNGTHAPQSLDLVQGREALPLEKLLAKEKRGLLRAVLAELAPADREVLTLRYALDYDMKTIAEVLGINSEAVYMRMTRARQRLAARLTELGVAGP